MRRALYGTSALIAVGLATGPAFADSGLKLGITGFYRGAAGAVIGGDSVPNPSFPFASTAGFGDFGRTSGGFRQEIRINFTGQTTFDNGLTVGVLVGINGENLIGVGSTSTPQKQSWVDFRGKFGNVRFGEANSALTTDCVGDPGNVTANFGVNSPNESFSNAGRAVKSTGAGLANATVGVAPMGSIGTCYGVESRGTKIEYFTPTLGGLTFAISYTPSGSTRNPGGGYFYGTDLKNRASANVLSIGADFSRDFGGTTLTIGGGGEWALDSYTALGASISDKPSTYQLGAQLGIGGFVIGASGAYVNNYKQAGYAATDALGNDNGWIASAGASYSLQAWSVGLQGIYSRWDVYGKRDHDAIWGASLNSAYTLGPGITLEGQIAYSRYDANGLFGPGLNFLPFAPGGTAAQPASYGAVEIDGGFAINF
jgi:outer membrane protein OmpU